MATHEDALQDAEEQMLAHEVETFYVLLRKVGSRLAFHRDLTGPEPDVLTDAAIAAAFQQTLTEDPDARDLAQGVAAFLRFGMSSPPGKPRLVHRHASEVFRWKP